jgi:hypothetical protein
MDANMADDGADSQGKNRVKPDLADKFDTYRKMIAVLRGDAGKNCEKFIKGVVFCHDLHILSPVRWYKIL